jgi:hypothetical protein
LGSDGLALTLPLCDVGPLPCPPETGFSAVGEGSTNAESGTKCFQWAGDIAQQQSTEVLELIPVPQNTAF